MNSEVIPFPTGQTNAQLYNHQRNLTAVLRRFFATLSEGGVDLTAIETAIADLETEVAAVQDVNSSFETIISAETVLGSLAEVANRQETLNEANARATISAAVEAHRAGNGVRSMVSVTDGHSELITSLNSAIGVTNANVTTLQTTVADGDAALAADITAVETTVAGNTASIASTITSVNGINAQATITLSVQGRVIGKQTIGGSPLGSYFGVDADYFYIGNASYADKPVLTVSTVGGTGTLVLHGNMYGDGFIATRMLQADIIEGNHIKAGEINAGHIDVATLSAIAANIGTVTAGTITDPSGTYVLDIANGIFKSADNLFKVDAKNKTIDITF